MDSEETTVSLAAIPEISATAALQSPKPKGMNMGSSSLPMVAIKLYSASTIWKRQLKFCSAHNMIEARKIIVPALIKNALLFSHKSSSMFLPWAICIEAIQA